jgi:inward rectifier potassium channel
VKKRSRRDPPLAIGRIERVGYRDVAPLDLYHSLLTASWTGFFGILALAYLGFNLVFAALFLLQDGSIANARHGSFADAFFFSVQTMATIGYGDLRPQTAYANLLVTLEVALALAALAVVTGLIFARFSRPTARVLFSHVAVVTPHDGIPTLMFRAANIRRNQILEAQVNLSLLRDEVTADGVRMRRFYDLKVVRSRTPMFMLTWLVMHPIDADSPLHGTTPEAFAAQDALILISLIGLDETFSQTIHARHSYAAKDLLWNRRFVDILGAGADGGRVIDYRRFHDTVGHDQSVHPGALPQGGRTSREAQRTPG